jgi:hypothetical protein
MQARPRTDWKVDRILVKARSDQPEVRLRAVE